MEDEYFKRYCKVNGINIKSLNDNQIKRLKDTVGFKGYVLKRELESLYKQIFKDLNNKTIK